MNDEYGWEDEGDEERTLKTLKDFTLFNRTKDDGGATLLIDSFDLRAEAIKCKEYEFVQCMTAPEFIDWWFNITAEELK